MRYVVANFDGYHYMYNQYTHLPNFAFLPFFTTFTQIFVKFTSYPLLDLAILNKLFFWFSIQYLQKICLHLQLTPQVYTKCILLFIYNPASVFFYSVYSESLYSFLTFAFIENQMRSHSSKIKSTLLLSLSVLVRSTALFLLPLIGIPILYNLYHETINKNIKKMLK
jgi:phosphatidylinositol glycan class V